MVRRVLAVLTCLLVPGCMVFDLGVTNPIPGLSTVAVAPFMNLSAERAVDDRRFAITYFAELQKIPGFQVVPVGVTEQAITDHQLQMNKPDDVLQLAEILNVDVVVIGAVTDYDPYYPPRIGLQVSWYSPKLWSFFPGVQIDPNLRKRRRVLYEPHGRGFRTRFPERLRQIRDRIRRGKNSEDCVGEDCPEESKPDAGTSWDKKTSRGNQEQTDDTLTQKSNRELMKTSATIRGQSLDSFIIHSNGPARLSQTGVSVQARQRSNSPIDDVPPIYQNFVSQNFVSQNTGANRPVQILTPFFRSARPETVRIPGRSSRPSVWKRRPETIDQRRSVVPRVSGPGDLLPPPIRIIPLPQTITPPPILSSVVANSQPILPVPPAPGPRLPANKPSPSSSANMPMKKPPMRPIMVVPAQPAPMVVPPAVAPSAPRELLQFSGSPLLGPLAGPVIQTDPRQPLMSYTRLFDGAEADVVATLRDYVELNGDLRSGGWEGYLHRSEDFIRFTAHRMIVEMLTLHGGEGRRRIIFKLRKYK